MKLADRFDAWHRDADSILCCLPTPRHVPEKPPVRRLLNVYAVSTVTDYNNILLGRLFVAEVLGRPSDFRRERLMPYIHEVLR